MTLLRKSTAAAVTLTLIASPALAQTGTTPPAPSAPIQDEGAAQSPDMSGVTRDAMREMMREMMMEMMQGEPRADGPRGARAERRGDRWHRGPRMDRARMRDGSDDMRSGMMHGVGMRVMFAAVDADGDGALSVTEVQDFHGRIFRAIDQNEDRLVEMTEIESFFHGTGEEASD